MYTHPSMSAALLMDGQNVGLVTNLVAIHPEQPETREADQTGSLPSACCTKKPKITESR
jgi:hypothetical protein